MSFDLRTDSPLLDLRGDANRIRFAVTHPDPARPAGGGDTLLGGASEVDLTPPPGMPKAGYSANATDGRGFRTRLRARVLHLQRGDASVAVVQCDLLGGSAVLAHLVARHVAGRTDVPLAGLMIGATHTHAGPGQFLGTDFYNRFASNRPGFDPGWAQFLATQIADGVVQAVASRVAVAVAVGTTDVWGLTRNRSHEPHTRNPEVVDKRLAPQRKWVGVNPQLHLVRVDAVGGATPGPLAAMVVFSVHGTGISMKAPEYNADLWAYVVGEMSQRIEAASGHSVVAGAVEGTHADVAPAVRPGRAGYLEARRIGQAVGADAADLWDRLGDELSTDVALGAGLHEVDLQTEASIDGVTLARRPAVGAALVAGAHENVTPVLHRLPPFRPGTPKPWRTRHPQAGKWVLGTRWLQPLMLPLRSFPRVVAVQVVRIGDSALVGLPFEVTVASGRRIAGAVADAMAGAGVGRVVVSSVANEYAGYVATAEEYARQHYEGGHTLYGPDTQRFVTAHAAALAARVAAAAGRPVHQGSATRAFDLRVGRYLPVSRVVTVDEVPRVFDGPAVFTDPDDDHDARWSQHWIDAEPGALRWHHRLVSVQACGDDGSWGPARSRDGRVVDDQGWDVEVIHLGPVARDAAGAVPAAHRYRVRWHQPVVAAGVRHRFVLAANGGRPEVVGPAFD